MRADIIKNRRPKAKIPGWRTMTQAQRTNARYDRIWEEAKRLKTETRFNLASRPPTSGGETC